MDPPHASADDDVGAATIWQPVVGSGILLSGVRWTLRHIGKDARRGGDWRGRNRPPPSWRRSAPPPRSLLALVASAAAAAAMAADGVTSRRRTYRQEEDDEEEAARALASALAGADDATDCVSCAEARAVARHTHPLVLPAECDEFEGSGAEVGEAEAMVEAVADRAWLKLKQFSLLTVREAPSGERTGVLHRLLGQSEAHRPHSRSGARE